MATQPTEHLWKVTHKYHPDYECVYFQTEALAREYRDDCIFNDELPEDITIEEVYEPLGFYESLEVIE
jgi:hypothetical protein